MKNKKLALLLTIFYPGLGHLYIGSYSNAAVFIITISFLWFVVFYKSSTFLVFNNPRSYLVLGALVFIYLYALADVFFKARKVQAEKGLKFKNIVIPGLIVFLALALLAAKGVFKYELEYQKDQAHLAASFKTLLPEQVLDEVKYPVPSYLITTGGFCWLQTGSGIIHYLEPEIDLYEYVLYGQPILFTAGRNSSERYGPGMNNFYAFKNLGYEVYRGSTSPIHPPENVVPGIKFENLIYFKDVDEEFLFAKKLLNAGLIPIVHVNDSFIALAGYNNKGVWLGSPEVSHERFPKDFLGANLIEDTWFLAYEEFIGSWSDNHQMFWFEKTGQPKIEAELYVINKKNAVEAPANIKKTIEYLKNSDNNFNISRGYTYDYDTPSAVALYYYFQEKGNYQLAQKYLEIAKIFDEDREALGPNPPLTLSKEPLIILLEKVLPLYEQAALMWE
ncbi:hypothetical protein KJ840_01885 [Patescibacteria group bacterium]|nr:hypothetical protein [Patescibacteria group bacterium]